MNTVQNVNPVHGSFTPPRIELNAHPPPQGEENRGTSGGYGGFFLQYSRKIPPLNGRFFLADGAPFHGQSYNMAKCKLVPNYVDFLPHETTMGVEVFRCSPTESKSSTVDG